MNRLIQHTSNECKVKPTIDILIVAVWFGLVAGLVEGTLFLAFQRFGNSQQVSVEIIWVWAGFNLVLFGAVGLVLALIHGCLLRVPLRLVVCLFSFLAFLDWLGVTVRERIYLAALLIFFNALRPIYKTRYQFKSLLPSIDSGSSDRKRKVFH